MVLFCNILVGTHRYYREVLDWIIHDFLESRIEYLHIIIISITDLPIIVLFEESKDKIVDLISMVLFYYNVTFVPIVIFIYITYKRAEYIVK